MDSRVKPFKPKQGTNVRCDFSIWITVFLITLNVRTSSCQLYKYCTVDGEARACFPSTELILGSTPVVITVDPPESTCGLTAPEKYQKMGDLLDVFTCEVGERLKENMIDEFPETTTWQSKTWTVQQWRDTYPDSSYDITITLSLKKKYRMSGNITFIFQSGRPQGMTIEKSADNGRTWQIIEYYARKCEHDHPEAPTSYADNVIATICTEEYSTDSSNPVVNPRLYFPGSNERMKAYSTEAYYTTLEQPHVKDFFIFTDIRIKLTKPATDGKEDTQRPEYFFRYYYAISDIEITGSCFCNLHAGGCITDKETGESVCDCSHNTEGVDCERCQPLYNNKPWREGSYLPPRIGTANACEKCECYDHATSCTYDADLGKGVCDDCDHNTAGIHCDECLEGFYPDLSLPFNDINVCPPCDCEPEGLLNPEDTSCVNDRNSPQVGQCTCKSRVTGRRCDQCDPGFYGLLDPADPGTCKACGCQTLGTQDNANGCDQTTGQCVCKSSIEGRACDKCKDGFHNFPTSLSAECTACGCDTGGSLSTVCNNEGICECIANVMSTKCNQVITSHYMPSLEFVKQPVGGSCVIRGDAYQSTAPFDGEVFATCGASVASNVVFESIAGGEAQLEISWPSYAGLRYTLDGSQIRTGNLQFEVTGNSGAAVDAEDTLCPVDFETVTSFPVNFAPGIATGLMLDSPITLDQRCTYSVSLSLDQVDGAGDLLIDSMVFMPGLSNQASGGSFATLRHSGEPNVLLQSYASYRDQIVSLSRRDDVISSGAGRDLLWSLSAELYGEAKACNCDARGSSSMTECGEFGGQCQCKVGVGGRRCDRCLPGYYDFSDTGCKPCMCAEGGSLHGACDVVTGQCPCRPNVATNGQKDSKGISDSLQCRECLADYYGYGSEGGCTACACTEGSTSTQCDDHSGQCPCKDTIGGLRCERCEENYYLYSADTGCIACGCNEAGSTSPVCDQVTGICTCRENSEGDKCEGCKTGFFNLALYNPRGCQPCFCFGHGSDCTSASSFGLVTLSATSAPGWTVGGGRVMAPAEFLGDHHSSYGLMLQWEYTLSGGEGDLSQVDMVSIQGAGSSLTYRHASATADSGDFEVRLFPEYWVLNGGAPPTPQEMYRVLASITELSFAQNFNGASPPLLSVSLQTGQTMEGVTPEDATGAVEECTCSTGTFVAGLSCESCGAGRQRINPSVEDPRYDRCRSCSCSGNTEGDVQCDEMTGRCLNCRNGTMGDNCEMCAANVRADACDTCMSGFWGLGADGCRACDCSDVGALPGLPCDDETGQCTCKSHVTGRQCDTCEENYHQLTDTGCSVCEGCYSLVQDEAIKLRGHLATSSEIITKIQAADDNAVLGPFIDRINDAQNDAEALLEFLETATAEEAVVRSQIAGFTGTITRLSNTLDAQDDPEAVSIRQYLAETGANLADAQDIKTETENNIRTVNTLLGDLGQISSNMAGLVGSLQEVQTQLATQTAGSEDQVQKIMQTVETIQDYADRSIARADSNQQEFQRLFNTHSGTSQDIASLDNLDLTLEALSSSSLTEAQRLKAKSNGALQTAQNLQRERTVIGFPAYDFEQRDNALIANRNNLATTKSAVETNRGSVESKAAVVNEAIAVTDVQKTETNAILQEKEDLAARFATALRTVEEAEVSATQTLDSAANMLDVMVNFDSKAAEVEGRADVSLEFVNGVNEDSLQVISDSESIISSVSAAQQASSEGLDTARQARTVAQQQNTEITPVYDRSVAFQQITDFDLTEYNSKSGEPASINMSLVQPAWEISVQQGADISRTNNLVGSTRTQVEQTKTSVEETINSANSLLNDLNNLPNIDQGRIEELTALVPTLAPLFNEQQMITTITNLGQALEEQTTWLNTQKEKKASLEREVAALKLSQQGIVATED